MLAPLLALGCCGAPAAAGSASGALSGVVRIGPTAPVCRAGEPCTKPAAGVVLTFTRGLRHVSTTTDRGTGRYRVRLPAGSWSVRASTGMRITPDRVKVVAARSRTRDFSIDTGIR
jgi:hypothetical protein